MWQNILCIELLPYMHSLHYGTTVHHSTTVLYVFCLWFSCSFFFTCVISFNIFSVSIQSQRQRKVNWSKVFFWAGYDHKSFFFFFLTFWCNNRLNSSMLCMFYIKRQPWKDILMTTLQIWWINSDQIVHLKKGKVCSSRVVSSLY